MTVRPDRAIEEAQSFLGDDLQLTRLDQVFELQRLMGPVIAYKVLLGLVINGADAKEQRLAASKLLDAANEDPEQIAARLRASIFHDLTLAQLEAIVMTGVTDPAKAVDTLRKSSYISQSPEEMKVG